MTEPDVCLGADLASCLCSSELPFLRLRRFSSSKYVVRRLHLSDVCTWQVQQAWALCCCPSWMCDSNDTVETDISSAPCPPLSPRLGGTACRTRCEAVPVYIRELLAHLARGMAATTTSVLCIGHHRGAADTASVLAGWHTWLPRGILNASHSGCQNAVYYLKQPCTTVLKLLMRLPASARGACADLLNHPAAASAPPSACVPVFCASEPRQRVQRPVVSFRI